MGAAAGPAANRAGIVLAAEGDTVPVEVAAGPVAVDTVPVGEVAAGPAAVDIVPVGAAAGPVAVDTVPVGAAGPVGDSDEAGRATTVAGRFAASVLTILITLITKILTAFAGI